jgi:parallel beta-helix repeat protein
VESEIESSSRICPITPSSKKILTLYFRPNPILVAVSLTLILMTSGLVYHWMLPSPTLPTPLQLTPHPAIAIDGDANFSITALQEGWPGDGSPENPYIINGLEIDLTGGVGHCISINNTRVNFIVSNCSLNGADVTHFFTNMDTPPWVALSGAGIHLLNVSNGELVNNTCNNNNGRGICIDESYYNMVANNTCNNNFYGILLSGSDHNIVANNTCSRNDVGISLGGSDQNTVANNTCSRNDGRFFGFGINLYRSESNTVFNNTCNSNKIGIALDNDSDSNIIMNNTCNNNKIGIALHDESDSNTLENNTILDNTEHDIVGELANEEPVFDELAHKGFVTQEFAWLLAGFGMIIVTSVIALVQFRRMEL